MKNLEKDQLEILLEIIGSTPGHLIAHMSEGGEMLVEMLHDYCLDKAYKYQLNCIDMDFYETMKEKYQEEPNTGVLKFALDRRVYKIQAREYHFLFVSCDVPVEDRASFLEKSHAIIRTAGHIVIFIAKNNYDERDSWTEMLEEKLYVSTSIMDDLFESYDVVISKRMHGWGDK